ncbi:MAG TPA: hypothetical protein VEF53_12510 [Patescibacteria group bacterium]|nr:hypothetical protein [Patescibacteria group bacterium]
MKRVYIFLLVIFLFAGCAKQSDIDIKRVDDISIFYVISSYAMSGAEQAVIDDLYEEFNSLTFEKTSEKLNYMSAFMVNFYAEGEKVKKFFVDKNGVFQLDDDTQCYKIASGEFDYVHLKEIYTASRQKKGDRK